MNGNGNLAPLIWIKVEVSKGMFSTEKAVFLKLFNGKQISIFADDSILQEQEGVWYLKVTKIQSEPDNKLLILLPSEAFETSSRWAEVSEQLHLQIV